QRTHFARIGATGSRTGGESLDVAHAIECLAESGAEAIVPGQEFDCIMPGGDPLEVAQWRYHPLAQQSRTHRSHRPVEYLEQRDAPGAGTQRFDQLEVATRHLVDPAELVTTTHGWTLQVGQSTGLQFRDVAEQRAGCTNRCGICRLKAQPVE